MITTTHQISWSDVKVLLMIKHWSSLDKSSGGKKISFPFSLSVSEILQTGKFYLIE